jgi:hypothetical protein
MAITAYALLTTNSPAGPYYSGGDLNGIAGSSPGIGVNVFGYSDGLNTRIFYSSNGNGPDGQIALPTLVTPPSLPSSYTEIGTSGIYVQTETAYPFGLNESEAAGQLAFSVTFASGSPDVSSPATFYVSTSTVFLIAASSYELP